MRCTCFPGRDGAPMVDPAHCPVHGQRTPEPTTGTSSQGEGSGVPVVDLTETIHGLLQHADNCRVGATNADRLAAGLRREADYLESLATTLAGATERTPQ